MRHINENERLELTSVDEVEDKLHDVKIKPTIQTTQSTEKRIINMKGQNNDIHKIYIVLTFHLLNNLI